MKYWVHESYSQTMAYGAGMFHSEFERFSRYHFTAFAMVVFWGLLLWWSPDEWGRGVRESSVEGGALSERVMFGRGTVSGLSDQEGDGGIEVVNGGPVPRVSLGNFVKNPSCFSPDAPDSEVTERAIAARLEKGNS